MPAYYTCLEPVTVFRERDGAQVAWFSMLPEVFFCEFQPWWRLMAGSELPERACRDDDDRGAPLADGEAAAAAAAI